MFGRLLRWYTIYTSSRALARLRSFVRCKIHFASKSCALLNCQRYCTVHSTRVVGVSQILRRWAEGATYIRQGRHHVGNWLRSTFVVFNREIANCWKLPTCYKHLASIQNLLSVRLIRWVAAVDVNDDNGLLIRCDINLQQKPQQQQHLLKTKS